MEKNYIDGVCMAKNLRFKALWESALNTTFQDEQWQNSCIFAHKFSVGSRFQEPSYKLPLHWYITLNNLKQWFLQSSDIWWRCNQEIGSLVQSWWKCPLITPFWQRICELIILITDTKIKLTAACCLLHISECSMKTFKKNLTRYLLITAKVLIPQYWKFSFIPSIKESICDVKLNHLL